MMSHKEPVGIDNDEWINTLAKDAEIIVCAWGALGGHHQRDEHVIKLLSKYKLMCFGLTKDDKPRHPLYIKSDKQLGALN